MKKQTSRHALLILAALSVPYSSWAQTAWMTSTTPNVQNPSPQATLTGDLGTIYNSMGASLIWTGHPSNSQRLRRFLEFLPEIERHGLRINDYRFEELYNLMQMYPQQTEHQFTSEVLRLMRDVSVGRLDPRTVHREIKFKKRQFQVDNRALNFINSPSAYTFSALAPQHQMYRDLQETLIRLKDINSRGGIRGIRPPGPTLKLGVSNPTITEMKSLLNILGFNLNTSNEFDYAFDQAIRSIQIASLTKDDGILSSKDPSWAFFKVSTQEREQEVELLLEKVRWLPEHLGNKYIFLNIASQEISVIDPTLEYSSPLRLQRAIVGRVDRKTPTMADKVVNVVVNPTWTVPPGIFAKDKLPALLEAYSLGGPDGVRNYLADHRFSLMDRTTRQPIDPAYIDWTTVTASDVPFLIVQSPGDDNALGVVKFMLTNPYNIYLHDTNERGLFKLFQRLRSSGCVRIEHPLEFAAYLLQGSSWDINKLEATVANNKGPGVQQQWVKVAPQMQLPVYMMPLTAYRKDGKTFFAPDRYGQNDALLKALKRAGYYKAQDVAPAFN